MNAGDTRLNELVNIYYAKYRIRIEKYSLESAREYAVKYEDKILNELASKFPMGISNFFIDKIIEMDFDRVMSMFIKRHISIGHKEVLHAIKSDSPKVLALVLRTYGTPEKLAFVFDYRTRAAGKSATPRIKEIIQLYDDADIIRNMTSF